MTLKGCTIPNYYRVNGIILQVAASYKYLGHLQIMIFLMMMISIDNIGAYNSICSREYYTEQVSIMCSLELQTNLPLGLTKLQIAYQNIVECFLGNFFFLVFFLNFLLYFFGRNNNRAGILSILFLKQRRHNRPKKNII